MTSEPFNAGRVDDVTPSGRYSFSFHGRGGTLFGIQIVNLLLVLVTLGVYYFWAKARVRSYLWSQIDFHGDRFAYHGTGKEVFFGFLKALLVFGIPFFILQNVPALLGAPLVIQIVSFVLLMVLVFVFIPVATVGTRRYQLSRSSWRGIRFSFRGRWREFALMFYVCMFFQIITLGFYTPYYEVRRQTFMLKNSYFGNRNFDFDGKGRDLLGSFALAVILALPTLFITLLWYHAKKTNYVWNHTIFNGARFKSDVTFGGLFKLYFLNVLILIFTLGIGASWAKVRNMRYYASHLVLEGQLDLAAVVQDAQQSTALGEQIGDFLSIDFDLG